MTPENDAVSAEIVAPTIRCQECGHEAPHPEAFTIYDDVTRCYVCEHEASCANPTCGWCASAEVTIPATGNGMKSHDRYDTFLTASYGAGNTDEPEIHLKLRMNDGSEFAQGWFRVADLARLLALNANINDEQEALADAWDSGRRARPVYLGPNGGHYGDCMGWGDCDCASYLNPYRPPLPGDGDAEPPTRSIKEASE